MHASRSFSNLEYQTKLLCKIKLKNDLSLDDMHFQAKIKLNKQIK